MAYLASDASSHISGKVFGVQGDSIELYQPFTSVAEVRGDGHRWDAENIPGRMDELFAEAGMDPAPENMMARSRHKIIPSDAWPIGVRVTDIQRLRRHAADTHAGRNGSTPASSAEPTKATTSSRAWAPTRGHSRPVRCQYRPNTRPMSRLPSPPPKPW